MKPVDCRNETWKDVVGRLNSTRARAYEVARMFGPGTTEQMSMAAGMSLLTLRPRICELVQMGLVEMAGDVRGREGIYKAVPLVEAERRFLESKTGNVQMSLPGVAV
jgi:hypothetical protein